MKKALIRKMYSSTLLALPGGGWVGVAFPEKKIDNGFQIYKEYFRIDRFTATLCPLSYAMISLASHNIVDIPLKPVSLQCEPTCHISRKTLLISTKPCESIKWTSMYCCPSWHPVTILIVTIVVLTLSCCYLGHRCLSCWYFGPEIMYHTQRRHFYQLYGSIKTTDLRSAPFMSIPCVNRCL